jgi:hypothetical protein
MTWGTQILYKILTPPLYNVALQFSLRLPKEAVVSEEHRKLHSLFRTEFKHDLEKEGLHT